MVESITCPHCKKHDVVKRGFFKTEAHGKQQRYFCKRCNKKFIARSGFYRMKNSAKKITCALDLFYKGVSTRKVQEHFQAFYPHNSSNVSIYRWVIKYSNMISKFTDKIKIKAGKEVQIDEMEYTRKNENNKGIVKREWFIDSIDVQTRYMTASNYVEKREHKEFIQVLRKVRVKTEGYVTTITTDGFNAYDYVVKKVWGYSNRTRKYNVVHNKVTASKGEGFNLYIERLHNSIRERTKIFRGFHGSLESARTIMKGYEIFYNFIRKHQAIGCCPYELATDIKLNGNNKWIELIGMAI